MAVIRLVICIVGVYSTFLLWAIAQERPGDKLPSSTFVNVLQSLASCLSALCYLSIKNCAGSRATRKGFVELVGWDKLFGLGKASRAALEKKDLVMEGKKQELQPPSTNGSAVPSRTPTPTPRSLPPSFSRFQRARKSLLGLILQVSAFQTLTAPIGFASLRYISYPMLVLGKSCKLVPVLLMNVLVYRRKFKPYKYAVVALVSVGISLFMMFGKSKKGKGGGAESSAWGLGLLGLSLLIDGMTNSTQDELFSLYPTFTGQALMFNMSFFSLCMTVPLVLLPPGVPAYALHTLASLLPIPIPSSYLPAHSSTLLLSHTSSPLFETLDFLASHPTALFPMVQYALLGGLGQLFIFETISHFGSLTLVMLTVTRKLVTMLLSVFVFGHELTGGQWAGVGVVFGGVGLEAAMKRREILDKQIAQEKHKSRLKAL